MVRWNENFPDFLLYVLTCVKNGTDKQRQCIGALLSNNDGRRVENVQIKIDNTDYAISEQENQHQMQRRRQRR